MCFDNKLQYVLSYNATIKSGNLKAESKHLTSNEKKTCKLPRSLDNKGFTVLGMYVTHEKKIRAYLFRGKKVSLMINMKDATERICTMPDTYNLIIDSHIQCCMNITGED